MNLRTLATLGAFLFAPALAMAQSGTNAPVGQNPSTSGINAATFSSNTNPTGFLDDSTLSVGVVGAGSTQAGATLLLAQWNVIATCTTGQGVQLPAVNRPQQITVINKGAGTCSVYPPLGAQIDASSVNAAVTQATGVNASYLIASPTQVYARP